MIIIKIITERLTIENYKMFIGLFLSVDTFREKIKINNRSCLLHPKWGTVYLVYSSDL